MPTYHSGRHENGQNFLSDRRIVREVVRLVADTTGPIIEVGAGSGALTGPLSRLGRPLTALEIDEGLAARLRRDLGGSADVIAADFLHHRLPLTPHVLVGNLPFHQTTAMLRRILHAPAWTDAILLVQWEVARRRAGVGASTMMTAQWTPWVTFTLGRRVPAAAFTPRPGVDGGLLVIARRADPLLPDADRRRYQAMVHRVHTARGRGLAAMLASATSLATTRQASGWLRERGMDAHAVPGALDAGAWVDLYRTTGTSPPRRG